MKITRDHLRQLINEELTAAAKQEVSKGLEDVKNEVESKLPTIAAIVQKLATDHRGEKLNAILGQIQAALKSFEDLDLK